jgi:hypothetical protein
MSLYVMLIEDYDKENDSPFMHKPAIVKINSYAAIK